MFVFPESYIDYPLVTSSWPGEGTISVYDVTGQRLATFSREFLRLGHVLNWAYIQTACSSVVQEPGTLQVNMDGPTAQATEAFGPSDLQPLDLDAVPAAGEYWYIRDDRPEDACTWARGPCLGYVHGWPAHAQDSTMSHPSRMTARRKSFAERLVGRDGRCIVTDSPDSNYTVAAHILPVSRPEYFREILGAGPRFREDQFRVSYGILLDVAWHMPFDMGDWALYQCPDTTDLIVHVFKAKAQARKAYHGKRIPRSRFRIWDEPDKLPDPRMLEFHYRQCLIKHVRGFEHLPA